MAYQRYHPVDFPTRLYTTIMLFKITATLLQYDKVRQLGAILIADCKYLIIIFDILLLTPFIPLSNADRGLKLDLNCIGNVTIDLSSPESHYERL